MDAFEREKLVRRISNRRLYGTISYNYENLNVVIIDPSLDLLSESDWIYTNNYEKEKESGEKITMEESYRILKEDGIWTDKLDDELNGINKDIDQLNEQFALVPFNKSEQKRITKTIEKGKKRQEELYSIKNQLLDCTLEAFCQKKRRHFLICKSTKFEETDSIKLDALANQNFLDSLCYLYYGKEYIKTEQIRLLARSDPWRLYWILAKNNGTSLFPHSCVEMTDFQYSLVAWSRIYDFAYESANRPSDETFDNDIKFDRWYEMEVKGIKSNNKANDYDQRGGRNEIFIMADQEGAKEVYEMNDPGARARVASREKAIKEKGELKDAELPDVVMDLQMEANQLAMKAGIQT